MKPIERTFQEFIDAISTAEDESANLEKTDMQADPTEISGKVDMAECRAKINPAAAPGSGGSMYTRKAYATREASRRVSMTNRTPARDRPGVLRWRRGS